MKKSLSKILILVLVLTVLVACGSKPTEDKKEDEQISVALVVNTNLGDNSFSDLVWSGVQKAGEDFNLKTTVVELMGDATKQIPTLTELAESEEWDLIVAGTFNLKEAIEEVAQEFPDQKFIAYDTALDFEGLELDNAMSVMALQNEGTFLAGALGALLTVEDHEYLNPEKVIGFVGGGENSAINDFLIGYIEGAKYIDEDVKVLFSYIGDFNDTAKGKELATSQYNQGADIVIGVAGPASLGILDASKDSNKVAFGVDLDHAMLAEESSPETAEHIVTSVLKRLDVILYNKIDEYINGTLEWGVHQTAGVADDGMSLAKNKFYDAFVSDEIKTQIDEIEEKIRSGEIVVPTAIGLSTEEVDVYKKKAN